LLADYFLQEFYFSFVLKKEIKNLNNNNNNNSFVSMLKSEKPKKTNVVDSASVLPEFVELNCIMKLTFKRITDNMNAIGILLIALFCCYCMT